MRKKVFASLLFVLAAFSAVAQTEKPYGYLYCHMSRRGEWTAFALSRDGEHWHDLNNGNEVYDTGRLSAIEGGARDAYIARSGDGKGVADYTEEEAERLMRRLEEKKIRVSAVGSPIGKIGIGDDFEPHFEKLAHVMRLAKIWDTPYIRSFSFFIPEIQQ